MDKWEIQKLDIQILVLGRIVYQDLAKITKSIEDGDFFSVPEFVKAIENCKEHNSKLHLIGLLSDGGVHSHNRHLYGLLEMAKRTDIYIVVFCAPPGLAIIVSFEL